MIVSDGRGGFSVEQELGVVLSQVMSQSSGRGPNLPVPAQPGSLPIIGIVDSHSEVFERPGRTEPGFDVSGEGAREDDDGVHPYRELGPEGYAEPGGSDLRGVCPDQHDIPARKEVE